MVKMLIRAKNKKVFVFLVMLCICAGLLSGCSKLLPGAQTEKPQESASSEQLKTETAAEAVSTAAVAETAQTETSAELVPENDFKWEDVLSLAFIPPYSADPAVEINGNVPFFTEEELHAGTAFASYSELDSLGRCGPAFGLVGAELQPTGERESAAADEL